LVVDGGVREDASDLRRGSEGQGNDVGGVAAVELPVVEVEGGNAAVEVGVGFECVLRRALLGAECRANEVGVEAVDSVVAVGVADQEDVESERAKGGAFVRDGDGVGARAC
jgi:hypothetical protein